MAFRPASDEFRYGLLGFLNKIGILRARAINARARNAVFNYLESVDVHPPRSLEGALGERRPLPFGGGPGAASPRVILGYFPKMGETLICPPFRGGVSGGGQHISLLDVNVLTDTRCGVRWGSRGCVAPRCPNCGLPYIRCRCAYDNVSY